MVSVCYLPLWQLLVYLPILWHNYTLATLISNIGTCILFFIGLIWAVWWVEKESRQLSQKQNQRKKRRVWDPRNLDAYGKKNNKLRQSVVTLISYTTLFILMGFILSRLTGCSLYESPLGGGEEKQLKQVVKIQKVVDKKLVINPYSHVLFNPPPIDDINLQVLEVTEHLYKIGQGKGTGAGFSAGTTRGKVRFIRLKYDGGDWQQDMNRGSDLNLLTEYGVRTGHPVSDRPEPMEIGRLNSFPPR